MMRTDGTGRLRFAGAVLLVGTFVVGALGGLAYAQLTGRAVAEEPAAIECDDHDHRRGSFLDQLQLAPEQQERIDAILQTRKEQIDAFWAENGPRMEQIVDSTRAEIRNALTEEQRADIDRMRAERKAQREREKAACDKAKQEKQ
jgi:Spy/CpxP family protein refolding chaperone